MSIILAFSGGPSYNKTNDSHALRKKGFNASEKKNMDSGQTAQFQRPTRSKRFLKVAI